MVRQAIQPRILGKVRKKLEVIEREKSKRKKNNRNYSRKRKRNQMGRIRN